MPDAVNCENHIIRKEGDASYTAESSAAGEGALTLRESGHPMSYRDLKVWQLAREVSIEIHQLTLQKLPRLELHEEGSQIRRSAKSVRANIVEGFGRRRYKQDFIKHLVYAEASCDETVDHLDTLFDTASLTDRGIYEKLRAKLLELGRRLNRFIAAVEAHHESPK